MGVPAARSRGEGVHPPGSSATPGTPAGWRRRPPRGQPALPTRLGNPPAWASPALGAAGADPAPPCALGAGPGHTRVQGQECRARGLRDVRAGRCPAKPTSLPLIPKHQQRPDCPGPVFFSRHPGCGVLPVLLLISALLFIKCSSGLILFRVSSKFSADLQNTRMQMKNRLYVPLQEQRSRRPGATGGVTALPVNPGTNSRPCSHPGHTTTAARKHGPCGGAPAAGQRAAATATGCACGHTPGGAAVINTRCTIPHSER